VYSPLCYSNTLPQQPQSLNLLDQKSQAILLKGFHFSL